MTCTFKATNSSDLTTKVVVDVSNNDLVCTWQTKNGTSFPADGVVNYGVTISRKDNNETIAILQGSRQACAFAPAPNGEITASPTTDAAAPLSGGAVAGIVVGLLALVLLVFGAALIEKRRRDEKRRQREAALAAKRAAEDAEAGKRDNANKVPPELVDPLAPDSDDSALAGSGSVEKIPTPNRSPLGGFPEDDDDIVVVPVSSPGAPPRKYGVGDCVQYLDTVDETWRFTFVRNFATNPLEYLLEDERHPIPESRMRWPNYVAGEAVEVRRRREAGEDWMPAIVAFTDADAAMVGLMGSPAEQVPCGDVRPAPFKIGENVEERGPDGEWRPAVVVGIEPDGRFIVDGAGGLGLQRTRKRLRWPQYHGGDIVEVRPSESSGDGSGPWRRATVVTMEGGIVVALEDGVVDPKRYQNCDVRRPLAMKAAPPPPPVDTSLEEPSLIAGDEQSSPRRKFKRRDPLDFHELPDFCFEITIDKKHGMGVRFGWTRDQLIVVQKFLGLPGMDAGPLEASERVSLGDQLLAINGQSIGGRSFAEVTDIIRQADDVITLKFGRWRETVKMRIPSMRKSEGPSTLSQV